MKLSTKSTYGLRAVLNIALEPEKRAISTKDISKREGISITYLEQLLNRLRRKGLIRSVRGPKGGYVLSARPDKIKVSDVVRALEGISPIYCITDKGDFKKICRRSGDCVTKIVWMKLARAINECLESMTLKDLCCEARKAPRFRRCYEKSVS